MQGHSPVISALGRLRQDSCQPEYENHSEDQEKEKNLDMKSWMEHEKSIIYGGKGYEVRIEFFLFIKPKASIAAIPEASNGESLFGEFSYCVMSFAVCKEKVCVSRRELRLGELNHNAAGTSSYVLPFRCK